MNSSPDRSPSKEMLPLGTLTKLSAIAGGYAVNLRDLVKSNPDKKGIYGLSEAAITEAGESLRTLSRLLGQLETNPSGFSVSHVEMQLKDAVNQRYSLVMATGQEPERQLSWRLVCGQFLTGQAAQRWLKISCLAERLSQPKLPKEVGLTPALVIYRSGKWCPRTHVALRPGDKEMNLPQRKEAFFQGVMDLLAVYIITSAMDHLPQ